MKTVNSLGFLTVVEDAELGFLGGYLLLNEAGRPLEFHCTAPVKPNRAQEILYGWTLRPFLYAEQIGQTLLAKPKVAPLVVCTDCEPMLTVREFTELPVVMVLAEVAAGQAPSAFPLARQNAVTAPGHAGDQQAIRESWPAQADGLDLLEPFARIREALSEAQKMAREAA